MLWARKQMRLLCRKQFFTRSLGLKIARAQQQEQQAAAGGCSSRGFRKAPRAPELLQRFTSIESTVQ